MARKPIGRFRSVRGQQVEKEFNKEVFKRDVNIRYIQSNGVANEDGQRVNLASRPTNQSPIHENNSSCKDTFTTNDNLDALSRGSGKSNPPLVLVSKEMERSTARCGGNVSLEEETRDSVRLKDDSISTLRNSKVQVPLKMKATVPSVNNVKSLRASSVHNQPISRLLQTNRAHMPRDHYLINGVSGNMIDPRPQQTNLYPSKDSSAQCSRVVNIEEPDTLEKSIEGSRQPQFEAMEGLVHKENNSNEILKYKACPSRVKEGSTSVQAMEGLIHKAEDVDKSSKCNSVVSPRSKGRPSSCQVEGKKNRTKKVVDEGVQWLDGPNCKTMKSEQSYIEICEDGCGDVNDKNPMSVETNKIGEVDGDGTSHVKDDNKIVERLENGTCGVMKEQRKTKQAIEHDGSEKNLVDVEDDNDGGIRTGFSIKMNNEATNNRSIESLMAIDGKTHDVQSKGRKELMQEKTFVTLGEEEEDDDDSEEVLRLAYGQKKKRRRYIVTSEDEEVEADGTEFSIKINNEATNNRNIESLMAVDGKTHDVKSKGRKELMQERTFMTLGEEEEDDDSEEISWLTYGQKKKRRQYIVISEDEEVEADGVGHDHVSVESKERAESKAQAVMSMDCLDEFPLPFVPECVEQQCYCCSKPIDEPVWRGTLKIDGKEYTSLVGHLSTKSGEKVWRLSRSLQTSVEAMKFSRSKVIPKIWGSSKPSDDNIGLYFFPHGMRHDANFDELINEVMENDLVLQAVIGQAEMLIFPSCILPERYKTFQRKHYLWALFKRKEDGFAVAAKPLNGKAWCAQEEEEGKQHVSDQQDGVHDVEPNQEMVLMKSAMPLDNQGLVNLLHLGMENQGSDGIARGAVNCEPAAETASCFSDAARTGFQLKAPDEREQGDARCHNVHATEASAAAATDSAALIAEATALAIATNAANIPANHEQFDSSMGVEPGRIFYFVAIQTPRVGQIIQELKRENSLVFAMRAEAVGAGPGPGSIVSTTMQQQ